MDYEIDVMGSRNVYLISMELSPRRNRLVHEMMEKNSLFSQTFQNHHV